MSKPVYLHTDLTGLFDVPEPSTDLLMKRVPSKDELLDKLIVALDDLLATANQLTEALEATGGAEFHGDTKKNLPGNMFLNCGDQDIKRAIDQAVKTLAEAKGRH